MLIDWFTVSAQVLNFLILVWLMKRFLYKPILKAIDAREKRIAQELTDAGTTQAEARRERGEFQQKNETLDAQRAALLSRATDQATAERARLFQEARQAADLYRAQRQESLASDARNLNQAITRRTQDEVFAIARKVLTDLATASLEERMSDVFTRRLRDLPGEAKQVLAETLRTAAEPAIVRSAFDLPAGQRVAIQSALDEAFSARVRVRFETAAHLISGIELSSNGQKVAWSIAGYLESLEQGVAELLKVEPKATPARPAAQAQ